MHEVIRLYAGKGKVGAINSLSLFFYRVSPHKVREAAVYSLYALRKSRLPGNRFVIFAQGRTGSTVLVDLMNSHPDIFTFPEIMQHNVVSNLRSPRRWAEGLATLSRKPVCGFKVKIYQLENTHKKDPKRVLQEFHDHGWKIIYLKRTNLLRHAISDIRSEKTGHFHNAPGDTKAKRQKIQVSLEELLHAMKFREDTLEKEARALEGLPYLTIEYEKDLLGEEAQRAALNRVFEFLGLPAHDAETGFRKVTSKDVSDDVENFAELESGLQQTEYSRFLGWG